MVTFFVLLLGIVSGVTSAPEPSHAPSISPAPAMTVTVNVGMPTPTPGTSVSELRDPFFALGPRVAITTGHGADLLDPFSPARIAARMPPSGPVPPVSPLGPDSPHRPTRDGLYNPFST